MRDPRVVALSLSRVPWLPFSTQAGAVLWARTQRRLSAAAERWPERIQWVRYESLVADPQATPRQVVEFLGLSLDDDDLMQMMQSSRTDIAAFPQREWNWKGRAVLPLDRGRVAAWKTAPLRDIKQIECQCWDEMLSAGYRSVDASRQPDLRARLRGRVALARTLVRLPPAVWCSELAYRARHWIPQPTMDRSSPTAFVEELACW